MKFLCGKLFKHSWKTIKKKSIEHPLPNSWRKDCVLIYQQCDCCKKEKAFIVWNHSLDDVFGYTKKLNVEWAKEKLGL